MHTAAGALKLSARCGDVPEKSTVASRRCSVHRDADGDDAAVVHLLAEAAVAEPVEHAAHGLLGVVLHVLHVGGDHRQTELTDHARQLRGSARVGRDLGAQVREVLGEVADRVGAAREQGGGLGLAQLAALHEAEVLDEHALVLDAPAVGRHGAGRDAADVGVVGARGDEEERGGPRRRRPESLDAGASVAPPPAAHRPRRPAAVRRPAPRRPAPSAAPPVARAPSANTGVTTVRSGRCVPPAYGELSR